MSKVANYSEWEAGAVLALSIPSTTSSSILFPTSTSFELTDVTGKFNNHGVRYYGNVAILVLLAYFSILLFTLNLAFLGAGLKSDKLNP